MVNNLAGNVTVTGNGALTVNATGTGAQTVITGTGQHVDYRHRQRQS